jgi:hypothetical protein
MNWSLNKEKIMKCSLMFSIAIALAFNSQLVHAGSISDSYNTGDTLTAVNMNNIKTAVNDNNNTSRFYGDGSAGPLTVSAITSWTITPPAGNNLNFTDVVIDAGFTLTVPAGTTIRCTGTFTNNGTINIAKGADKPGTGFSVSTDVTYNGRATSNGHPGDSFGPASSPDWHNDFTANPVIVDGGNGGTAIPKTFTASSFNSFRIGGGSGSGHSGGSEGGGLIKIYCNGAIINSGTINANGLNGSSASGGGGGGIVILGSQTSVDNSAGTISATGGNGGNGFSWGGNGGGGGGGIIAFISPVITSIGGTLTLTGGTPGTGPASATTNVRIGGGGGGASGGNGALGGNISFASALGPASQGGIGYSLEILANPANMM